MASVDQDGELNDLGTTEVHDGVKRRAEAKYAEALERAEQARRNVAVVLEKASPATLAAAAKKSAAAGIADSRRDDPAKTIR